MTKVRQARGPHRSPACCQCPSAHPCPPAPPVQWGEHVAVCGEGPLFGNWDVQK